MQPSKASSTEPLRGVARKRRVDGRAGAKRGEKRRFDSIGQSGGKEAPPAVAFERRRGNALAASAPTATGRRLRGERRREREPRSVRGRASALSRAMAMAMQTGNSERTTQAERGRERENKRESE
eukprot:5853704-Pleurochrysis_carterae.AAC.3